MKRNLVSVIFALVLLAMGTALWRNNSTKQVLADGTVLVLSGLRVDRTNAYWHGTGLSKMLGRLVPYGGVRIGPFELERAESVIIPVLEGRALLMAELRLTPGEGQQDTLFSQSYYFKYRLLISGDHDDYAFVNQFLGFHRYPDGMFAQIGTPLFPRDSRLLRFRLEERHEIGKRDWCTIATFVVKNPKPAPIESWKPDHSPRFMLAGDLEVEVGELTVRHEPMVPTAIGTIYPPDIWKYAAYLPIRMRQYGKAVTNWGVLEGKIRDASGNADHMPELKVLTNDWMMYRMCRPLDPAKLWKFEGRIGRDADFPTTNLYSFTVGFPLPGPLQTNLGEFPCRIEFVRGYNLGSMLSVQLTNNPPSKRMTFLSAVDDDGKDLRERWSGLVDRQHSFWQNLELTKPTQVHVTVAICPDYEMEFTLQPRYEKEATRVREKRVQSKAEH